MTIKSYLLPIFIVLSVVFIYVCDGNTSCTRTTDATKDSQSIGKQAYINLKIDEDNSYWKIESAIHNPIKISVLQLAEKIKPIAKPSEFKEFKHKEVTLIQDTFMLKFFHVLHLKENRLNSKEPGKYGELGPYQILKAFWIDGCKQLGVDINSPEWCYETNVWNDAKCKAIILAYFEKYKVPCTIDDMCGAFNSGNRWTKKWNKTVEYRKIYKEIWFKEYNEKI